MKKSVAAALVAFALIAGVGAGFVINAIGEPEAPAADVTAPVGIVPGGVTPVMVGDTIEDAVATGLVVKDAGRSEVCEGEFWKWSGRDTAGLDIIESDGEVVSIGVGEGSTLTTGPGIGIGSTLAELTEAYGDDLIGGEQGEYGQTNYFFRDDVNWIGFLFDEEPDQVTDTSTVVFIEVGRGIKPGLIRDGC